MSAHGFAPDTVKADLIVRVIFKLIEKPSFLQAEALGCRRSLLVVNAGLTHHRSRRLSELLRVRSQCTGEGVPRTRLSLGDLEFSAWKSDPTFNVVDGGHARSLIPVIRNTPLIFVMGMPPIAGWPGGIAA